MNKYKKITLVHRIQYRYEYKIISLSGNSYVFYSPSSMNDILNSSGVHVTEVEIWKDQEQQWFPSRTWFGKWKAYVEP